MNIFGSILHYIVQPLTNKILIQPIWWCLLQEQNTPFHNLNAIIKIDEREMRKWTLVCVILYNTTEIYISKNKPLPLFYRLCMGSYL